MPGDVISGTKSLELGRLTSYKLLSYKLHRLFAVVYLMKVCLEKVELQPFVCVGM